MTDHIIEIDDEGRVHNLGRDWNEELAKLETKRLNMHNYIIMKLDEQDYHGIADAAMDLRELDARCKAIKEWIGDK